MIIGSVTKNHDGFEGTLTILTVQTDLKLIPVFNGKSDNAPDYRVYANGINIGAAWKRTSKGDDPRDYIAVKLDDPAFAAPVYANLVDVGEKMDLIWSR